jgi:hypothetical protein
MNEQNKDCPVKTTEYTIDDKKYIVHAHFIGEKDVDTIIRSIAFNRAMNETFSETAA